MRLICWLRPVCLLNYHDKALLKVSRQPTTVSKRLALHEPFEPQPVGWTMPYSVSALGSRCKPGLAAAVPVLFDCPHRINDRNKELIRRAFSVRTPQLI